MTVVHEGAGLGLDGARLVGLVLRVLERVDRVHERVGEPGDDLGARGVTPLDEPAAASRPRYATAAGRIIVRAMSSAQLASMFWTLT